MKVTIADAFDWAMDPECNLQRLAPRPPSAQAPEYSSLFDSTTIGYDAFHPAHTDELFIVGPPFLNLLSIAERMKITAQPGGSTCSFTIKEMDRHMRLRIQLPPHSESVRITSGFGEITVPGDTEDDKIFAGRRVLLTLSKDNHLDWICDWIRFHRDIHGADAVLLYDNGSCAYTVEQLAERLSGLAGIEAVCIVKWNYKYGPQGSGASYWDSDFCQSGALEDARWRFLQNAKSVLNVDIDELAVTSGDSVFEIVESRKSGYVAFRGIWVVDARASVDPESDRAGCACRHRDFKYTLNPRFGLAEWRGWKILPAILNRCSRKWAAVPNRHADNVQWQVHRIRGMAHSRRVDPQVEYRHFRPINTSWNYSRTNPEPLSAEHHREDDLLLKHFERVRWSR